MKDEFKLVLAFTTGRSGTAYLSQVFGHSPWSKEKKTKIRSVSDGKYLVVHEAGFGIPTQDIKRLPFGSPESLKIQKDFIHKVVSQVRSEYPYAIRFFNSNMMFGRFLGYALPHIDCDYRLMFVKRKKEDVVASFAKVLYRETTLKDIMWNSFFNSPIDALTINKVDENEFNQWDRVKKYGWFYDEFIAQWERLKLYLDKDKYIETEFENFTGEDAEVELDRLSDFIGIPYSKDMITRRVNTRDKAGR